jgi:hypothetical protein
VDKLVAPIPILFEDMNFSLVKGGGGLVEWAPGGDVSSWNAARKVPYFEAGVRTVDTSPRYLWA